MLAGLLSNNLYLIVGWASTRILAIATVLDSAPFLHSELYSPFVSYFISKPSFDPWTDWQLSGGVPEAFPYGFPFLLLVAILFSLSGLFVGGGATWVAFLTLCLILDFVVLRKLRELQQQWEVSSSFPMVLFVFSPTVILGTYFWGALDMIALFITLLATLFLLDRKALVAGALFGAAAGLKVMLLVFVPILFIYLIKSSKSRMPAWHLSLGFIFAFVSSTFPVLFSPGYRAAFIQARDAIMPLTWGFETNSGSMPVLPFLLAIFTFFLISLRRMNPQLLMGALAIPLLTLAVLPGAPIGWSIWAIPFLGFAAHSATLSVKSIIFLASNLAVARFIVTHLGLSDEKNFLMAFLDGAILATGLAAAIVIWRVSYAQSDFVRLKKRPALVLIGGDSGVGKDTLANGLVNAFGPNSSVHVSGDDYHRWGRDSQNWRLTTHLNPLANSLTKYFQDVLMLSAGTSIRKPTYSHETGRLSPARNVASNDLVIASGLHALANDDLCERAELSVFLEMDEELRRSLKVERDTKLRGHKEEGVLRTMRDRTADAEAHVEPQKKNADIVFRTSLESATDLKPTSGFVVRVETNLKHHHLNTVGKINALTSLWAQVETSGAGKTVMLIQGNSYDGELQLVLSSLEPRIARLLGSEIAWHDGAKGIIQLFTLIELSNNLRRKRLVP